MTEKSVEVTNNGQMYTKPVHMVSLSGESEQHLHPYQGSSGEEIELDVLHRTE